MDFIDDVRARSSRFAKRVAHLREQGANEEATKTALVLPFIEMLGYDFHDPAEVVPEFTADVGVKKGEKVDYALMHGNTPAILLECKRLDTDLSDAAMSQLLRYFTATEAVVGILTDGVIYRFFADLDQANVMDSRSFFEFNMLDFTEEQVKELKRFTKSDFDHIAIIDIARDLKYTKEIKRVFARELAQPSNEFAVFVAREVYQVGDGNKGRITAPVRKMFKELTHSAFNQFINDKINDRLKSALSQSEPTQKGEGLGEAAESTDQGPVFTDNEEEALNIVKAILAGQVDVAILGLRRAVDFTSVMLGGKRVLCRLRFRDAESLSIRIQDADWVILADVHDLYDHAEAIRDSAGLITSNGVVDGE